MRITKEAKRYLLALVIITCWLGLVTAPTLASNITGAKYSGVIQISNNGTTANGVSVNISISSAQLVAQGFADANLSDTAILNSAVDTAFMPGYDTSPWAFWIDTIGEDKNISYTLYTDNASEGKIRWFPGPTGMTISDSASLEPSDNFSARVKGRFNTTAAASKDLASHYDTTNGGVQVFVSPSVSENITGRIVTLTAGTPVNILPNATGTYTNIASVSGAATHWQAVDDAVASPDDDTTYVYNESAVQQKDAYNLETPAMSGTVQKINSVTVYFRAKNNGAANEGKVQPFLRLGSNETTGTEVSFSNSYETKNETLAKPGGGSWSTSDLTDLQVAVGIRDLSAARLYLTQVYVQIAYDYEVYTDVSATGIPSGELEIELELDAGLDFDGVDDLVAVADSANITDIWDGGGTFTCWINTDSDGEADKGHIHRKVSHLETRNESGGKVELIFHSIWSVSNGDWSTTSTEVTLGEWTFVAITYNSDATGNNPTFYVNDKVLTVGSGLTEDSAPTGTRTTDGGSDFVIGNAIGGNRSFEGDICEVRMFDRALSASEIAEHRRGVYTDDTDLVGYWKMDEGTGTTATDTSGGGNNGTISGATWASPGLLKLNVDSTQEAVTGGVSVPNSSADWTLCEAAATPYVEYAKISVDGVLQSHIIWQYATTFTDQSGNSHDATPTFRTTSSDADVSAILLSFGPISEAKLSGYDLYEPEDILSTIPTAPGELYTDLDTSKIIGGEAVDAMLTASGTPKALWWFPFVFISLSIIGLLVYGATRMNGGNGSLLTMAIVIEFGLFIMGVMNPIPLVAAFLFLIPAAAFILHQKHIGWG